MSKLQLQVGDTFYIENKNEIRIITNVTVDRVHYKSYALVNGRWELLFYNNLDPNSFLLLFGEFKVPKLKAIILKSLIKE